MEYNDNEQPLMIDVDFRAEQSQNLQGVHAPTSLVPAVLSRLGQVPASILSENQTDTIARLLNALQDGDWHIRATAVRLLGELGEQAPVEPLIAALNDEDETVRATTIRALGKLDERVPVDSLLATLHDSDWSVREIAALTLGALGERVPVGALRDILNAEHEDTHVREAAKLALQQSHSAVLSPLPSVAITTPQVQQGKSLHDRARTSMVKLINLTKSLSTWNIVPKDEQEEYIMEIQDVDDVANCSDPLQQPVLARPTSRFLVRIGEGVLVALLIAGIALSWLALAQRSHPSSGSFPHSKPTPTIAPAVLDRTGHNVSLTIADGVVYAGSVDNAFYALRSDNGSLLWRYNVHGAVNESPLIVNGVVYVSAYMDAGQQGTVYALRASDGFALWHFTRSGSVETPTVVDGVAYIDSPDGVTALRASDGTLLWHFTTQGSAVRSQLVVNGVVYVTAGDPGPDTVYALRASDGFALWHFTPSGYLSTPTVVDGVAYISSTDAITALRASDGTLLWHYAFASDVPSSLIVRNGIVYTLALKVSLATVSTHGGYLARTVFDMQILPLKSGVSSVYALRASDGMLLWHYTMNNGKNSWGTLFLETNGVIYAGAAANVGKNSIYALRASNGSVLWQSMVDDVPTSAVIANGVIDVGSTSGTVFALRTSDGSMLWHSITIAQVFNTPLLVGNLVYVSSVNGIVYTFRANDGSLLWYYQTA